MNKSFSLLAITLLVPLVATGFLFFCLVWFCTVEFGVGLTPDSASYLSTAVSLRQGRGMEDYRGGVSAHFPPGYPILVAITSATTFRDARHGAPRLLAAVSFALIAGITYVLVERYTRNPLAIACACIGVGGHSQLLAWASTASSEIPCLAFLSISVLFFVNWCHAKKQWMLVVAALAAAVACMTRYAAVVWPLATSLAIIITARRKSFLAEVYNAATFLFVSLLPLSLWFVYCLVVVNQAPRQFMFHPIAIETLKSGWQQILASIGFQDDASGGFIGVACIAGLLVTLWGKVFWGQRHSVHEADPISLKPLLAQVFFIIGYFLFLTFSISFLDRATPMDGRIFVPATWMLIVLTCIVCHFSYCRSPLGSKVALWCLLLCFSIRGLYETVPRAAAWRAQGIDLACAEVLYDNAFRWLREGCAPETRVFSNVAWTTYLATKRPVEDLPSRVHYTTGEKNRDYERELLHAIQQVQMTTAVIVMDTKYRDENYLPPTVDELSMHGLVADESLSTNRFLVFRADSRGL